MDSVRWRSTLGYLILYLATVGLGLLTVPEGATLALFWPAAGVAALWMMRARSGAQLVVDASVLFLGALSFGIAGGRTPLVALLLSLANVLQGLVIRVVVAHVQQAPGGVPVRSELVTLRGTVILLGASIVAATLGSPIGTTAGWVQTGQWSGESQLAWVIRHACGAYVIAAAALTRATTLREARAVLAGGGSLLTGEPRGHVRAELAALVLVTGASAGAVYSPGQQLPLTFAVIACSVWVGFRFAPIVGIVHTMILGIGVLVATMVGWGPLGAVSSLVARANVMQLYVALTTLLVLLLALGSRERQRLTTEIRTAEAESSARADLLDAVTTAMSDGLMVVTASGEVTLSNPAALALAADGSFDLRHPEVHGLRAVDGHPLDSEGLPHVRVLRGESVPPLDVLHHNPRTGKQRVLSVTSAPMRHGGDPTAVVMVIRDVTQERAREREAQAFAGVVAHDLRTPLGAMKMTLEGCDEKLDQLEGDVSGLRSNMIQMYATADRMEHLILDLLAFAQAQSGDLRPEQVSMGDLVDAVTRELALSLTDPRPLIEHGPLDTVVADPTLARHLIANLLGNAAKYVDPGTQPRVRVESRRVGDMVEVRVADNGIGIPEAARGRVFESFYRAAGGAYAGTGLGLAICARTVERHGGTIEATDGDDGTGTTIVFTLPGTEAGDPDPAEGSPQLSATAGQRPRRTTSADPPPRRTGSETAVS